MFFLYLHRSKWTSWIHTTYLNSLKMVLSLSALDWGFTWGIPLGGIVDSSIIYLPKAILSAHMQAHPNYRIIIYKNYTKWLMWLESGLGCCLFESSFIAMSSTWFLDGDYLLSEYMHLYYRSNQVECRVKTWCLHAKLLIAQVCELTFLTTPCIIHVSVCNFLIRNTPDGAAQRLDWYHLWPYVQNQIAWELLSNLLHSRAKVHYCQNEGSCAAQRRNFMTVYHESSFKCLEGDLGVLQGSFLVLSYDLEF